jgi:hypothetical protein
MTAIEDVPNLVFSQPMSTADEMAALVLDSAADGARERTPSFSTSAMTTFGYLFPGIARRVLPLVERRGARAKKKFLERAARARAET